ISMALASAFLIGPLTERFSKFRIVYGTLVIMALGVTVFLLNPIPALAYVFVIPVVAAFGVNYPLMITLFSASVDETEQGWVMGVTIAVFTLGAGLISFAGGPLMAIETGLPFIVSIAVLVLAIILIAVFWRGPDMRRLNQR
ncbi:MAG: MFS transporter, partial [Pseudomonadota bacterium]